MNFYKEKAEFLFLPVIIVQKDLGARVVCFNDYQI